MKILAWLNKAATIDVWTLCFKRVFQKKAAQEKNHKMWKKTAVVLEILSGVLVVNANQMLSCRKHLLLG